MRAFLYIIKGLDACNCAEAFGFLKRDNALAYCAQSGHSVDSIVEGIWSEDVRLDEAHERWRLVLLPGHNESRPLVFFEDSVLARSHFHAFDAAIRVDMKVYFPQLLDAVRIDSPEDEDAVLI